MRVILVTGSRDWTDPAIICNDIIKQNLLAEEAGVDLLVVHGGAAGADSFAEAFCKNEGIHTAIVNARWSHFGRAAGPMRNSIMAEMFKYDAVLAYPLEHSNGTRDMMKKAQLK